MPTTYQQPTVSETTENSEEIPQQDTTMNNDAQEADAAAPTHITINFQNVAGDSMSFKLKTTTKFKKAMDAYSARTEIEPRTLRFLFEGDRLQNDSTPASVRFSSA